MSIDGIGVAHNIDGVYFDSVNGEAGTAYPVGTIQHPVNNKADLWTILAARKQYVAYVHGVVSLAGGDAVPAGMIFKGWGNKGVAVFAQVTIAGLATQCKFKDCYMVLDSGQSHDNFYENCVLTTTGVGFRGRALNCILLGALTFQNANESMLWNTHSWENAGTISLTLGAPTTVDFVGLHGHFHLLGLTAGTVNIWADKGTTITIAASCTAGTINIYGSARVTNNALGTTVNNYSIEYQSDAHRGGVATTQGNYDDLQTFLDLARSAQSGTLLMTGAEQTLYEETDTQPFEFAGGYIDWTGLNFGAGENTTIKIYLKVVSGGAYRLAYTETFLAAALPVPILTPHPRDVATQVVPGRVFNVYGVKVTAQQAAVGAGWNTLTSEWFDAKRGS